MYQINLKLRVNLKRPVSNIALTPKMKRPAASLGSKQIYFTARALNRKFRSVFLLSTDESLSRRCYSAASSYSRPRSGSIGLRTRSESVNSLSRESLDSDSTLPDPMPHMRKSVVSTIDTNAPRPKMEKKRRHSTSKMTYANKPARKKSLAPQKPGNVIFKMTYQADQHKLEVHLINATELPIRHGRLLDAFARLSFKSPSKHQRVQSKVHKKTCNPIFDEKFVFENIYLSELQQAHLKIKLLDRLGVSRCEPVGEALISLSNETIMCGENVTRDLVEKAGRKQVNWVRNTCLEL